MLDFVKKLFGFGSNSSRHPLDGATRQAQEAPYKLEPTAKAEDEPKPVAPAATVKPKRASKPKAEKPAAPKKEKAKAPASVKPKKPKDKKTK